MGELDGFRKTLSVFSRFHATRYVVVTNCLQNQFGVGIQ